MLSLIFHRLKEDGGGGGGVEAWLGRIRYNFMGVRGRVIYT